MPADPMLAIGLLVVGFLLLAVEIVLIPGVGFVGLLGFAALAAGCWMLWTDSGPVIGSLAVVASLGIATLATVAFARSKRARKLVLEHTIEGTSGPSDELQPLVGEQGRVVATLRPSGAVEVGGDRFDAVITHGAFLESGEPVRVTGHEHGQLIVEPIEDE